MKTSVLVLAADNRTIPLAFSIFVLPEWAGVSDKGVHLLGGWGCHLAGGGAKPLVRREGKSERWSKRNSELL